jgi:hypothetical protein
MLKVLEQDFARIPELLGADEPALEPMVVEAVHEPAVQLSIF